MKTISTVFGISLTILAVVVLVGIVWAWGKKKPREVQMFLHNRGSTTVLDTKSPHFKTFLATCEEALTSAAARGRILRLVVSAKDIEMIKSKEVSIEVVYPEIKEFQFQIRGVKKTLKLDRLLISLSGRFAETTTKEKYVTIFYGVQDYGAGPYTNSGEFQDKIKKILKDMGHKVE